MRIGDGGFGKYVLEGGALEVDRLTSANLGKSEFTFAYGRLQTRGTEIVVPYDGGVMQIGTVPNQTATWLMGGARTIFGGAFVGCGFAPGARVSMVLSGAESIFDVAPSVFVLGWDREATSEFVVTNGAFALLQWLQCGQPSNLNSNTLGQRIVATGLGSRLNAQFILMYADSSSLVISDEAVVGTSMVYLRGNSERLVITGTNSLLNCPLVVIEGSGSEVIVSNGAAFRPLPAFDGGFRAHNAENFTLKVIGGSVDVPDLYIGNLLLEQGALTIGYCVINPGTFDFRSGVLKFLNYASSESTSMYIGGYSNRATLELSTLDNTESCYQNKCFNFRGPIILRTNASFVIFGGDLFTSHFAATNGPSSEVVFHRGRWTTEGTRIAIGSPLGIGGGTDSALLKFSGGQHAFANGLRVLPRGTVTGTGSIAGNITFENQSMWQCNLAGQLEKPGQPLLAVTGNLALHGSISLTNVSHFVPARYILATYSGTVTTNGATLQSGLPNSFRVNLDMSIPGEVAAEVRFIGPLPPNYIGNFAAANSQSSLSFATTNLATYLVEFTESLPPTAWAPLMEVAETSGIVSIIDTNATAPQRFYRLKTTPNP